MRVAWRWFFGLAVPLVLIMSAVRGVTLPWYPAWEYRQADFPPDPLGMPDEARLALAQTCIDFLNLPGGGEGLRPARLPNGQPAFNERELHHMDDVKAVYDRLTALAIALLLGLLLVGWDAVRRWGWAELGSLLQLGGGVTLLLLIGLGLWMMTGFEQFFTDFHHLFFSGGSWLFDYTDTLIRLFPLRFWQDAGLLIAKIVVGISLVLIVGGWWLSGSKVTPRSVVRRLP